MPWDTKVVPSLGGGINVSENPIRIADNEWSWGDGFIARNGVAEVLPTWSKINTGAWVTAGNTPVGLVQNPFDAANPALLVSISNANIIQMVKMSPSGVATTIAWDSVGPQPIGNTNTICMAAFLNNTVVLALGESQLASPSYTLIKYAGGTTFAGINSPSIALAADFLVSFKSTLVAGGVLRSGAVTQATQRQFAWSDINTTDTWDPAISNSADFGFLDDLASGITGIGIIGQNTLGLFTADGIHALVPSGGIPLFSRMAVMNLAVPAAAVNAANIMVTPAFFGTMPMGTVVKGADNLYLLAGSPQAIAGKVIRYLLSSETVGGVQFWCGPYLWHKRLGMLLVPRSGSASLNAQNRLFYYDPTTGAWSHRGIPGPELGGNATRQPVRQAYIVDTVTVSTGIGLHWWMAANGEVYREQGTGAESKAPFGGEYLDTKDFTFGAPPFSFVVNLIRVEWECLTNVNTDAIQIFVAMRDSFAPVLGSTGFDMQNLTFVSVGTLTGGVSDLPVNTASGKVLRFRIQQVSGLVRIRGFSFRYSPTGDRPLAVQA